MRASREKKKKKAFGAEEANDDDAGVLAERVGDGAFAEVDARTSRRSRNKGGNEPTVKKTELDFPREVPAEGILAINSDVEAKKKSPRNSKDAKVDRPLAISDQPYLFSVSRESGQLRSTDSKSFHVPGAIPVGSTQDQDETLTTATFGQTSTNNQTPRSDPVLQAHIVRDPDLVHAVPADEQTPATGDASTGSHRNTRNRLLIIVVLISLIIIGGLVVGIVLATSGDSNPSITSNEDNPGGNQVPEMTDSSSAAPSQAAKQPAVDVSATPTPTLLGVPTPSPTLARLPTTVTKTAIPSVSPTLQPTPLRATPFPGTSRTTPSPTLSPTQNPTSPTTSQPTFCGYDFLLEGFDLFGSDSSTPIPMGGFTFDEAVEICRNVCAVIPYCKAFSLVDVDEINNPVPWCFIKDDVPDATPAPRVTSGVRTDNGSSCSIQRSDYSEFPSTNFAGEDLFIPCISLPPINNLQQAASICADICSQAGICQAYTAVDPNISIIFPFFSCCLKYGAPSSFDEGAHPLAFSGLKI